MIDAIPLADGWLAFYRGTDTNWRLARDAGGLPIVCETEALAHSVARYRRRRFKVWR